jgi:hypothetical protein
MVLVMALGTLLMMLPLTLAWLQMGMSEVRVSQNLVAGHQAGALAESASEMAYAHVANDAPIFLYEAPMANGVVKFTMTEVSPEEYAVHAYGYIPADQPGAARRHITVKIIKDPVTMKWSTKDYREVEG